MNTIGDRIKHLRKLEGLTQKEFAERLLVTQSYLSGLENNNETPTSKLIKLICLEFKVNEIWLTDNIGGIYDLVYLNNDLSDISNLALLNIMKLLATKSKAEYSFYAFSLESFVSVLADASLLPDDDKLVFLELLQNIIIGFERAIQISISGTDEQIINHHKEEFLKDIEKIFSLVLEKI